MSHAARPQSGHTRTAAFVLAAALTSWCAAAAAQQAAQAPAKVQLPELSLAQLEHVFWVCDHEATSSGIVEMTSAMPCGVATEDLQQRKFGGDFQAMLAWWRQNKAAQHGALDTHYRAARLR